MKYSGDKSLDAEIELDIENGVINMDYTNSFYPGASGNSNSRLIIQEYHTYKRSNLFFIAYSFYRVYGSMFIFFPIFILQLILSKHFHKFYIKHDLQYKYQSFLKFHYTILHGMFETIISGKLDSKILKIPIRVNTWTSYELEEDYEKYIKKISLKRAFVKKHTAFKIVEQQNGWEMVFEFNEIPQKGTCKLKHLG